MSQSDVVSAPLEAAASNTGETRKTRLNDTFSSCRAFVLRTLKKLGSFSWLLFKKTAYIVFILVSVALMLVGLDKLAEFALKKTYLSDVYPKDFSMARRDFTSPVSHYDYDLTPGVAFTDSHVKGNRFEYANNAGFRDPRPISINKPDDEFRIFLTGGSTAFGLGATGEAAALTNYYYIEHRENIAHVMEQILNASAPIPGKKIRVYNTAVWGHAYQHLLMRYVTKLRQYKPDLVVSLDGVNELLPLSVPVKDWDYFNEGQFNGIMRQMHAYSGPGLASYLTLWLKNNTFLMTMLWKGSDPFFSMESRNKAHRGHIPGREAGVHGSGFTPEERSQMLTERLGSVVRVVEDYHSVLENDGVPHIFALQPLLYLSQKPRHEWEKRVEALGEHKQYFDAPADKLYKTLIDSIAESAQRKRYFMADFSNYFDDTPEWIFTDWCHLTAGANYLVAKELSNIIKENFFQKPLTEGDKIDDKAGFVWNTAVTAKILYAPPAESPDNGPENILLGYPGPPLYSSKNIAAGERLEIVLDLGREFKLSRLRLVWDDNSIPKEWAVEISTDGQNWSPWIKGADRTPDQFSWWPGYEYYGPEPVQGRYIKYRPVAPDQRQIRLRSLSLFR
jgi:hypothetical protein